MSGRLLFQDVDGIVLFSSNPPRSFSNGTLGLRSTKRSVLRRPLQSVQILRPSRSFTQNNSLMGLVAVHCSITRLLTRTAARQPRRDEVKAGIQFVREFLADITRELWGHAAQDWAYPVIGHVSATLYLHY
ncbi:hypothetical protein CYLTODRAFT_129509 [Cylindrobasidium torrendii FP15055 ss-10]|uniref:Uncharacterized protein n=1 Tax=Cylindrobasidium torrendii FP15055 ss-10 TaxID=1314674 RepID=A0A0D7B0H0_9AGAR|nr:hypothetical protein CYLTODRAFT_129509 [Cylindrobasidium torrendii FP15055 ss-10]